jgi:hypothetical protein
MSRWLTTFAAAIFLSPLATVGAAQAADQGVPTRVSHARIARDCGVCGCWSPEYVRHRQVVFDYPYDPRYTLTSEPFYAPGRMNTFIHNWF